MDEEKEDVEKEKDLETEEEELPEVEKEDPEEKPVGDQAEEIELEVPPENNLESVDEEIQAITIFETEKGPIHVVHEITFGDLIIATILMALLIFKVINQLVRRF